MKKSIRKRILPGLAVFLITLHITSYAAYAGELSIPNLISLTSGGPNEMTVVWEGVENAEGYRIYRASGSEAHRNTGYESDGTAYFKGDFDYVEVGLTDGTARSFTDETAIPGRSYEYTVEAFTAEGSGGVRTGLFGRTSEEVLAAYDLRFTNVTSKGFDVSGRVVSPTSVEKVMIAVWTKSDGQDDIEWKELKPLNGLFQTHVNTKVHKNEPGLYCVNVIPYDTEGRNPYDFGDNSETVGSVVVPENVPMLLNPAVNGVSKEGYEVALTYYAESEVVRAEAETYAESEGEAGKKTTAASVEAADHIIRARINASDHGNAEGLYHTVVRMTTKDGRVTSYEIPVMVKDAGTELSVTFIDVGFGDSILLESRGKYLLVDAGHSTFASNVLQILKEKRIDKVTVLTTHLHFDHVCGILPLIDAGFVSEIYADTLGYSDSFIDAVNVEKALDYAREKSIPIHEITKIDSFTVGDALIERIGPLKSYGFTTPGATNNRSTWLKVTGGGATYLLAGDAESVAERDMIAAGIDMKADYLKVSHHGLETSSTEEFILASSPKMTFVSDNLIFSPERHGGVTRWEDHGIPVVHVNRSGTVTHRLTDGESVVVAERSSTTEPAAIYVFQGTDYTGEFDPVYYADRYPDLKNAFGYNADLLLQHYVQYGIGEHRVAKEPAPGEKKYVYGGVDYTNEFDPVYYSDRYPDLKKAFGTNDKLLLQHYVLYGIREHRIAKAPAGGVSEEPEPEPEQEEQSGTRYVYGGVDYTERFDPVYYADRYPDLKKAFGYDAKLLLQHYVQYGIREHREAKKPQGGAEEDPPEPAEDPKPEGGSGRYVFQGVDYTDEFDPVFYADHYPDLKNAFGTNEQLLLEHYATYGIREHRMGKNPNEGSSGLYVLNGVDYTDVFNPRIYADRYPDLRKAFGYNAKLLLSHYVTHGIREGRKAI